ncbi:MAG: glycosyltransferase family 4 protein, partial [Gemmataceae bacterium]
MPPLRLLSLAHSYAENTNRRLPDAIATAGAGRWEVTVVTPRYFHGKNDIRPAQFSPRPHEPNRVIDLPAFLTQSVHGFFYGPQLRSILAQKWDLVHCWEEPYVVAGGQVAWQTPPRTPFVFRTAQSLPKKYPFPFHLIEKAVVRRCAGWICSGQSVEENLLTRPGYAAKPHARIPLGVDVERFAPNPAARIEYLRRLNWSVDGPPVIGYLGRFVPDKGLPLLMKALSALRTPWRAVFVGGGPLEPAMQAWAATHPDQVRILTTVRHHEVAEYVNTMDLLVAPSQTMPNWKEQFGRMLIEAFATK